LVFLLKKTLDFFKFNFFFLLWWLINGWLWWKLILINFLIF
jgi:hypothetical protein